MKALVHTKPYCFEYSDFPDPVPGDDEVLIRVKACGICGSDVHGFTGKTGRRIPPLIMGHEAAGIVEGSGKNVDGFSKGDRVGIWSPNCAEWTILQFGCAKIGAILVSINPSYRLRELESVATKARAGN